MITPLPYWFLTDTQPAFYDKESVTALQAISRLYGKMQEIIEFVNSQETEIQNTLNYIRDHLAETASTLFAEALENGLITAALGVSYDSETEALTFSITAQGGTDNA